MKNELTFTGEILEIFPIQTINSADGTKSWKKQEVHVKEFDEQYPQSAVFEVFGADKIDPIFGQFAVGDRGTFHLNIKGNAYDKKDNSGRGGSLSIGIWKYTKQTTSQASPAQNFVAPPFDGEVATPSTSPIPNAIAPVAEGDDLPF